MKDACTCGRSAPRFRLRVVFGGDADIETIGTSILGIGIISLLEINVSDR